MEEKQIFYVFVKNNMSENWEKRIFLNEIKGDDFPYKVVTKETEDNYLKWDVYEFELFRYMTF